MLVECGRAGIPVAVANARLSDRSLPRYRRLHFFWRPLLRHVSLMLAQSQEDERRWVSVGMPAARVRTVGNLKFDTAVAGKSALAALIGTHLPENAHVLVAGSTHPGEDAPLLRCFVRARTSGRVLLLAPRHPHRAEAVATQAMSMGLRVKRLSLWRHAPEPVAEGEVLVLDTVGELASLYSLAACAFVGGSLVSHGGQNPLEPAQFGLPIVMGESFENFREIVRALQKANAIFLVNETTLCERIHACLDGTAPDVQHAARHARQFYLNQAGATQRTVAELIRLIRPGATESSQP